MKNKRVLTNLVALAFLTVSVALAFAAQDKYTVKVPGGLGFAEFRGYEDWQPVGPSLTDAQNVIRVIVANPVMIQAYREGVPGNGKPFPDGSKIAKIEWTPKKITDPPFSASTPDTVPGPLKEVEFIEKDAKRFPDGHGWGFAVFNYDPASIYVHTRHCSRSAAAGERRQVRGRLTQSGGGEGLHFQRVRETVND
jgi:hypothetical protein